MEIVISLIHQCIILSFRRYQIINLCLCIGAVSVAQMCIIE